MAVTLTCDGCGCATELMPPEGWHQVRMFRYDGQVTPPKVTSYVTAAFDMCPGCSSETWNKYTTPHATGTV